MSKVLFVTIIICCGLFSFVNNKVLVNAIHTYFGVEARVKDTNQNNKKDMTTPTAFINDLAGVLASSRTLSDEDKDLIIQSVPEKIDYEYNNQGPYKNIFDFSVFDSRHNTGGILLVGDSTISWGFSISHFELMANTRVHALTFGLNIMDEALILATDKVINCYYDKPPTVLVSESLGSMGKLERLSRQQDQAIVNISKTQNCGQLYQLVEEHRQKGERLTQKKEMVDVQLSDILDFKSYRKRVARFEPDINPLEHVRLHRIIEPDKLEEIDSSDLYFYRWQPEFRIPCKHDNQYGTWSPASREVETAKYEEYLDNHQEYIDLIATRHRRWAEKNACFIIPLTLSGESLLRTSFLPDDSACRIDFADVIATASHTPAITMEGNHHLTASGGIVFAALAGKYIATKEFPTWSN